MGYVTYPLLTRSPLTILLITLPDSSFDLHVLATPPAFVLSQDQTLQFVSSKPSEDGIRQSKAQHLTLRIESAEKTSHFIAHCSRAYPAAGAALSLLTFGLTVNLSKNNYIKIPHYSDTMSKQIDNLTLNANRYCSLKSDGVKRLLEKSVKYFSYIIKRLLNGHLGVFLRQVKM